MLEQLRQNSRSVMVWIVLGLIIAAFVVFFGPQAGPEMFSCSGSGKHPLVVNGEVVREPSWRYAMSLASRLPERRARAFDMLVERELLAQAAEERGFRVGEDQINAYITNGEFLRAGRREFAGWFVDGVFNYDAFEGIVTSKQLGGLTVELFLEEQRREHLAEAQRNFLRAGAAASDEEVRALYIHGETRVSMEYLKFDVGAYTRAVKLSPAAIETFAAEQTDALNAEWETAKQRFSDPEREWTRIRHILVKAKPTKEGEPADDPAKRAEALLARINGGEDFAKVAKEVETGDAAERGGDLGWRPSTSSVAGTDMAELTKDLKPGQTSKVIKGSRGHHLVQLIAAKKGPLALEDVKLDLARDLARKAWGRTAAHRAANDALAKVRGKALTSVFPAAAGRQLTPEQIQELLKNNPIPGDMVPQPNGAPAKPTAPKGETGSLLYSSDVLPAQGGAEPETEEAKAPLELEGELPPLEGIGAPETQRAGPFPRLAEVPGLGKSKELMTELFDTATPGVTIDKVFELSGGGGGPGGIQLGGAGASFIVAQLVSRADADMDKFDEDMQMQMKQQLSLQKAATRLHTWLTERCEAAVNGGEIRFVNDFLIESEDQKDVTYSACATTSVDWIAMQLTSHLQPPPQDDGQGQ